MNRKKSEKLCYYRCIHRQAWKCHGTGILTNEFSAEKKVSKFLILQPHDYDCPCLCASALSISSANYENAKVEINKYLLIHSDCTPKKILELYEMPNSPFSSIIKLSYEQIEQIITKFRSINNISSEQCLETNVCIIFFIHATWVACNQKVMTLVACTASGKYIFFKFSCYWSHWKLKIMLLSSRVAYFYTI